MQRDYHKVLDRRKTVGYVAPTTDMPGVWSIYNLEGKKTAMVNPDGSEFHLMFYGKHGDDSTEYFVARSFAGAVARAFRLEGLPAFDPPLAAGGAQPLVRASAGAEVGRPADVDGLLDGLLSALPDDDARRQALDALLSRARARRTALG